MLSSVQLPCWKRAWELPDHPDWHTDLLRELADGLEVPDSGAARRSMSRWPVADSLFDLHESVAGVAQAMSQRCSPV
eukprot:11255221-Alexandrium_andersonii.AAC.1